MENLIPKVSLENDPENSVRTRRAKKAERLFGVNFVIVMVI